VAAPPYRAAAFVVGQRADFRNGPDRRVSRARVFGKSRCGQDGGKAANRDDKNGCSLADDGHSAFTLASWITLRHLGSSALIRLPTSSGEPAIDSKYCRSRKSFWMSGEERILRTSVL